MFGLVEYLFLLIMFGAIVVYTLSVFKILNIENVVIFYLVIIGFFGYVITSLLSNYHIKKYEKYENTTLIKS